MVDQKKIELIQQMLRKAESTNHPAEAEAFAAAAEKMMLRLGIDEAMLNAASETEKAKVVEKTMIFKGSYHVGKMQAAYSIGKAMGSVFMMVLTHRGESRLYIVGKEAQVDRVIQLVESLELQAASALKAWWKTQDTAHETAMNKFVMRRQFMISFGHGAGERILSEKREIVEEVAGAALVLRNEEQEAEDWARSKYKLGASRSSQMRSSYAAAGAGRAAGQRANVGTTGINHGKKGITA